MSWTEKQDCFLKENVGKMTHKEISYALKKGKRTVSCRVKKLGLSGINLSKNTQFKKIYSVNECFFNNINILNSYYAGLIASDGCINKNSVSITQSKKRLYAIERFARIVGFNGKIYKAKHKKGYDSFSISISSEKWIRDLELNFGIVPKKSLILTHPDIFDFKCKLSFIVGLIDGDGSVGFYKGKTDRKVCIISLCGTYDIVNWVKELWQEHCASDGKRKSKGPHRITNNNTWSINISGFKAIKFYKLIKDLDIPKMESKWDIFKTELESNGEIFYLKDFNKNRKRNRDGRFI